MKSTQGQDSWVCKGQIPDIDQPDLKYNFSDHQGVSLWMSEFITADSRCLCNNVGRACLSTCRFYVFFCFGFFLRQVPFTPEIWLLEIPDLHSASSAPLEEIKFRSQKCPERRPEWTNSGHTPTPGPMEEFGKVERLLCSPWELTPPVDIGEEFFREKK